MWKNNKILDLTELHTRLAQILPDYKLISARESEPGTYKAITTEGTVYLVTWRQVGKKWQVKKVKHLDYDALLRASSI